MLRKGPIPATAPSKNLSLPVRPIKIRYWPSLNCKPLFLLGEKSQIRPVPQNQVSGAVLAFHDNGWEGRNWGEGW